MPEKPQKTQTRKRDRHPKPVGNLPTELQEEKHELNVPSGTLKVKVVDKDLDNLFQTNSFTPLLPPPIPVRARAEDNQDIEQAPVDELNPLAHSQAKNVAALNINPIKESKSKKRSKHRDNSGIEASYETQVAIKKAKLFAQTLRDQAHSTSDTKHDPDLKEKRNNPKGQEGKKQQDSETGDEQNSSNGAEEDHDSTHPPEVSRVTVESEDDQSDQDLVHETLRPTGQERSKSTKKRKIQDSTETREQRNFRTLFVGNVNIECIGNKSHVRALLSHILNPTKDSEPLAPQSRIESYRFRGIPLAEPLAGDHKVDGHEHALKRSQAWKDAQSLETQALDHPDGGRAGKRGAKPIADPDNRSHPTVKFLTSDQKRKIGYVTGKLHPEAKSCIAYLVISNPAQDSNEIPAEELAKLIVTRADGTMFMDHVLRCDMASSKTILTSADMKSAQVDINEQRRTLFIGGLDFTEQEDSIRKAVEARLVEEKDGPPEEGVRWVERVRIVRDKATAPAKGFAYVLLRTPDAVDEMLALPEKSFKIGKRKVRLQKYVLSGHRLALKKLGQPIAAKNSTRTSKTESKRPPIDLSQDIKPVYKGPDLSSALANLPKQERKLIKANTPKRLERRMLKKQAKLKMKIVNEKVDRKIEAVKTRPLKKHTTKPHNGTVKAKNKVDKNQRGKKPGGNKQDKRTKVK